MTKREFAEGFLGCSYALWCAVLAGKRNLGHDKAKIASEELGTDIYLWRDPEVVVKNRSDAWLKYLRETV